MTVQQARKILGTSSNDFSDEVVTDFIQTAEILKKLFFDFIQESSNLQLCHNKLDIYDKTKSSDLCQSF